MVSGAGNIAPWFKMLTALPEGQRSVVRTCIRQFTTSCNSSFRESDNMAPSVGFYGYLHKWCACAHAYTQAVQRETHIHAHTLTHAHTGTFFGKV